MGVCVGGGLLLLTDRKEAEEEGSARVAQSVA